MMAKPFEVYHSTRPPRAWKALVEVGASVGGRALPAAEHGAGDRSSPTERSRSERSRSERSTVIAVRMRPLRKRGLTGEARAGRASARLRVEIGASVDEEDLVHAHSLRRAFGLLDVRSDGRRRACVRARPTARVRRIGRTGKARIEFTFVAPSEFGAAPGRIMNEAVRLAFGASADAEAPGARWHEVRALGRFFY